MHINDKPFPSQTHPTDKSALDLFKSAIRAIDAQFGADYARKNPALLAKYLDLLIAERQLKQN